MLQRTTPWPNKNTSILFGILFHKQINQNEKLFHINSKYRVLSSTGEIRRRSDYMIGFIFPQQSVQTDLRNSYSL